MGSLDDVTISHVLRNRNRKADALAKLSSNLNLSDRHTEFHCVKDGWSYPCSKMKKMKNVKSILS